MKEIPEELQYDLVVAFIDKKKIRNVVRKTSTKRRMIILLKGVQIKKRFEENVIKLASFGAPNL